MPLWTNVLTPGMLFGGGVQAIFYAVKNNTPRCDTCLRKITSLSTDFRGGFPKKGGRAARRGYGRGQRPSLAVVGGVAVRREKKEV